MFSSSIDIETAASPHSRYRLRALSIVVPAREAVVIGGEARGPGPSERAEAWLWWGLVLDGKAEANGGPQARAALAANAVACYLQVREATARAGGSDGGRVACLKCAPQS